MRRMSAPAPAMQMAICFWRALRKGLEPRALSAKNPKRARIATDRANRLQSFIITRFRAACGSRARALLLPSTEGSRGLNELVNQIFEEFLPPTGVNRVPILKGISFKLLQAHFAVLHLCPDSGVPGAVTFVYKLSKSPVLTNCGRNF